MNDLVLYYLLKFLSRKDAYKFLNVSEYFYHVFVSNLKLLKHLHPSKLMLSRLGEYTYLQYGAPYRTESKDWLLKNINKFSLHGLCGIELESIVNRIIKRNLFDSLKHVCETYEEDVIPFLSSTIKQCANNASLEIIVYLTEIGKGRFPEDVILKRKESAVISAYYNKDAMYYKYSNTHKKKNMPVIDWFLDNNLVKPSVAKSSLFIRASEHCELEFMKKLVNMSKKLNDNDFSPSASNNAALNNAMKVYFYKPGGEDVIKYLLSLRDQGYKIFPTSPCAFNVMIENSETKLIKFIIDKVYDDLIKKLKRNEKIFSNMLCVACQFKQTEIIQYIVGLHEKGFSIDFGYSSNKLIKHALLTNNTSVLKICIKNGHDTVTKDLKFNKFLSSAIAKSQYGVVKYFLNNFKLVR